MPFCPKCRYEYRREVSECPDCGVALVAQLPVVAEESEENEYSEKDWVAIARLTSPGYSEMVLEEFRAKGIPAVVLSETGLFGATGQMGLSLPLPGVGGYLVLVHRDFVEQANAEAELMLGEEWTKTKLPPR